MAAIDSTRYEDLCRLCAAKTTLVLGINIFDNEGTMRQLSKKIVASLPLQIHEADELPKMICESCVYKVESFFDFRERCIRTERLLVDLLKEIQQEMHQNQQQNINVVPLDQSDLIMVQENNQLLDVHNIENVTELNLSQLMKHQIILSQQNVDINGHSLDNITLSHHDLTSQDLSNHSLQGQENLLVETSNSHSLQSNHFSEDNLDLISQQHQMLSGHFRLQQDLHVDISEANSVVNEITLTTQCGEIKDTMRNISSSEKPVRYKYPEPRINDESSLPAVSPSEPQVRKLREYSKSKDETPELDNLKQEDSNSGNLLLIDEEMSTNSSKKVVVVQNESDRTDNNKGTNKKWFYCNICGASYDSKNDFDKHYEIHFYKCSICYAFFTNSDVLNTHRKDVHGMEENLVNRVGVEAEPGEVRVKEEPPDEDQDYMVNIVDIKAENVSDEELEMKNDDPNEESFWDSRLPVGEVSSLLAKLEKSKVKCESLQEDDESTLGSTIIKVEEISDIEIDIKDECSDGDSPNGSCTEVYSSTNTEILTRESAVKESYTVSRRRKHRKHFCYFCKEPVSNFARHIQRKHSKELEVQKILDLPASCKKRKFLITLLRKRGNYLHFRGTLGRPPRRLTYNSMVLPCDNCLGFYSASHLCRHKKTCVGATKTTRADAQNFLLQDLKVDTRLRKEIFPRMRADRVSFEAKNDSLICAFGASYLRKHRMKNIVPVTSRKMRELARLLIEVTKQQPSITSLIEALHPIYLEVLVAATKVVAKYDPQNNCYESSLYVSSIGPSIRQCCEIAIENVHSGKDIAMKLPTAGNEADLIMMIQLIDANWKPLMEISAPAKCTSKPFKEIEHKPDNEHPNSSNNKNEISCDKEKCSNNQLFSTCSEKQAPAKTRKPFKMPKKARVLVKWTDSQKDVVRRYFAEHIEKSKPPKQKECDELKKMHGKLLDNKSWLKIKVFVQNEYTKYSKKKLQQ